MADSRSGFDKQRYDNEYKKYNYDKILFEVPKGKRQVLKDYAKKNGISVKEMIVTAIESVYGLNLTD